MPVEAATHRARVHNLGHKRFIHLLTQATAARKPVAAAHDAAVDDAISWLERHGVFTRSGRNGVRQVDVEGSSRPASPIVNLVVGTRICTPIC